MDTAISGSHGLWQLGLPLASEDSESKLHQDQTLTLSSFPKGACAAHGTGADRLGLHHSAVLTFV